MSALGQKQTLLQYPDDVRYWGQSGHYSGGVNESAISQ